MVRAARESGIIKTIFRNLKFKRSEFRQDYLQDILDPRNLCNVFFQKLIVHD